MLEPFRTTAQITGVPTLQSTTRSCSRMSGSASRFSRTHRAGSHSESEGWAMEDGLLVPAALRASHAKYFGSASTAWIRSLPDQVSRWRQEWQLQLDGTPQSGAVALVVPVLRADGTPAVLKLQPVDDETRGEPIALACWAGGGAARLLERDLATGSMLLERLDARGAGNLGDCRAAASPQPIAGAADPAPA